MKYIASGRMSVRMNVLAVSLVVGLVVAGCGSGQQSPGSTGQAGAEGTGRGQLSQSGGGAGGFGGLGGSGKVAAVSGNTAQVQGQGSQVAVTWSGSTRFSQQVTAKASDLKVGDCVVALPSFQSGTGSSSSGSTSSVAAASVRISTATKGSCTGGFGGGGGFRGTPPSPAPGAAPSGAPGGAGGRGGFGAFGEVTALAGTSFTVTSSRPGSTSQASTVTVTTSSRTAWTRAATATAKDVKVGRCVVSMGRTGSTGAIQATSILISQPVSGSCSSGFGGRRPGFGGSSGQGSTGQSS